MAGTLPPMMQVMQDIGGVELPEFFGELTGDEKPLESHGNGAEGPAPPPPARTGPRALARARGRPERALSHGAVDRGRIRPTLPAPYRPPGERAP